MSIEVILTIVGLILTVVLYFTDKIINGSTKAARKYMLSKWCENKEKSLKLQQSIFYLANTYNGWNAIAIGDSPVTYKVFYDKLKERYEIEYSDQAYYALKTKKFSKFQIEEFTTKLKVQEENLYASQMGIDVLIQDFQNNPPV